MNFAPGTLVMVRQGPFNGYLGTILDTQKDTDQHGNPLPEASPGYYWVMVKLTGATFAAHMIASELKHAE